MHWRVFLTHAKSSGDLTDSQCSGPLCLGSTYSGLLQFYNVFLSMCFHAGYSGKDRLWRVMYWLSKASPTVMQITSACTSLAKANFMAMHKFKVAERAQSRGKPGVWVSSGTSTTIYTVLPRTVPGTQQAWHHCTLLLLKAGPSEIKVTFLLRLFSLSF